MVGIGSGALVLLTGIVDSYLIHLNCSDLFC